MSAIEGNPNLNVAQVEPESKKRRIEQMPSNEQLAKIELTDQPPQSVPSEDETRFAIECAKFAESYQLLDLVLKLIRENPSCSKSVFEFVNDDPAQRKLFVRGLKKTTTSEVLLKEMGVYGEIEEGAVIMDRNRDRNDPNRSKGFAFVTFKDVLAARKVVDADKIIIDGAETDITVASRDGKGPNKGFASDRVDRGVRSGSSSYREGMDRERREPYRHEDRRDRDRFRDSRPDPRDIRGRDMRDPRDLPPSRFRDSRDMRDHHHRPIREERDIYRERDYHEPRDDYYRDRSETRMAPGAPRERKRRTISPPRRAEDVEDPRRLFIRGLDWNTTNEILLHFFGRFGEIEEGSIVVDKKTGRSKGYAFINYLDARSAMSALEQPIKVLDNAEISCSYANPVRYPPGQGSSRASSAQNTPAGYDQQPQMQMVQQQIPQQQQQQQPVSQQQIPQQQQQPAPSQAAPSAPAAQLDLASLLGSAGGIQALAGLGSLLQQGQSQAVPSSNMINLLAGQIAQNPDLANLLSQ